MKGDRKDKHHLLKIFACKTILRNTNPFDKMSGLIEWI